MQDTHEVRSHRHLSEAIDEIPCLSFLGERVDVRVHPGDGMHCLLLDLNLLLFTPCPPRGTPGWTFERRPLMKCGAMRDFLVDYDHTTPYVHVIRL